MKLVVGLLLLAACTRPGDDRAQDELTVGTATASTADVQIDGGLAAVRTITGDRLDLWCSAPDITATLRTTAAATWTIVAQNSLRDAVLVVDGAQPIARVAIDGARPTVATFEIPLPAGQHVLRIAPPDADTIEPYRVAAMADIQTALSIVDDVFHDISAVPDARFVVSMGDITQRAEVNEFDQFDRQLAELSIPYYTTLGNHELWADPMRFFERYGRASFQFTFKGVAYTFVDSGDAGVDPTVDAWLVAWLAAAKDKTSIFLTHVPPIDPVGVRDGSFRSAADGHRLISELVEGNVDLALYGHIHTYSKFSHAGIPAYISGGGGADPMKLDGIDRHFLMVRMDPEHATIGDVEVHRVANRE